MSIRVLHVAECAGGVKRYLKCLLKYSSSENYLVLSQLYNKEDFDGLTSHVEIMNMTHAISIKSFGESFKLRKIIKQSKANIVYAHSSIAGALVRMACFGLKCKVIYNPHGWSFNMEGKSKKLFVLIERFLSHFCNKIICISEAEKYSALRNKICKEDKLITINNGIALDEYKGEVADLPIPKDAFVVGMVGRICKQKAPDVFVKMAGIVNKHIKNAVFVIVGDVLESGIEERKEIEELAENLGIKLLITGWVDNPLACIARFDVGCLLSRWEGFGLAIPEYMLVGVPIVATKVDAIPFLVTDGVDGMLVEKDNEKEAADCVINLAQNEDLRKKMIENCRIKVKEKFDARRMAEELDNLYHELCC